jgi:hypothetical protein
MILVLILVFTFQMVVPGFAHAASGPTINLTSGTTYSTSNPNLSFSVSSTTQLNGNSASMTVDGNSVGVSFTYSGYYDCPDCYTSGTIKGTPTNLHDGSHTITVTMKDVNGNSTTSQWTINGNSASMTVDGNSVGVSFTYSGYYDCPDCDPEYVITSYTSGTIKGTPTNLHDGSHTITVTMKDVNGNSTTSQWTINVNRVPFLANLAQV